MAFCGQCGRDKSGTGKCFVCDKPAKFDRKDGLPIDPDLQRCAAVGVSHEKIKQVALSERLNELSMAIKLGDGSDSKPKPKRDEPRAKFRITPWSMLCWTLTFLFLLLKLNPSGDIQTT